MIFKKKVWKMDKSEPVWDLTGISATRWCSSADEDKLELAT